MTTKTEQEFDISSDQLKNLHHLADILHLFHHRNKNQHRRSIWYRHFSIFRRQLSHYVEDLESLNSTPKTNLEKTRKKTRDALIIKRNQQRLEFWRDVLVTKWQHAFGQLVADGRFSVLGLVLMAVLAEVCKIVGVLRDLEELGQVEVEKVLEEFARSEREWDGDSPLARVREEDFGEVVVRQDDHGVEALGGGGVLRIAGQKDGGLSPGAKPDEARPAMKTVADPVSKIKKKKKRKKTGGDAIDDIFG